MKNRAKDNAEKDQGELKTGVMHHQTLEAQKTFFTLKMEHPELKPKHSAFKEPLKCKYTTLNQQLIRSTKMLISLLYLKNAELTKLKQKMMPSHRTIYIPEFC